MKEGNSISNQLLTKDIFVATEYAKLIQNKPGFITMVAPMYAASLIDSHRGRVFRYMYISARHIDDLVDGDKESIGDPIEAVRRYQKVILHGRRIDLDDKYEEIMLYGIRETAKLGDGRDDVKGDFFRLTNAILFDHERSKNRSILTKNELDGYYENLLGPSLNIGLICAGSKFRGADFPEMIYGQGRLYSVRDLKKDLRRGLCNIPLEVLEAAGVTKAATIQEILETQAVRAWVRKELGYGKVETQRLKERLKTCDGGAKLICTIPLIGMERIIKTKQRKDS